MLYPWTQAQGTSEPLNPRRGQSEGVLSFAGMAGLPGRLRTDGTPSAGAPLAAQEPFQRFSREPSCRSCHPRPRGVTADTDGDRQEDAQAGALTREQTPRATAFRGFQKGPTGSGRGCSQALPPRERRRSPIQAGRIPLCAKPLSPHLHVSDAFCPSGFPWTQAK